MINVIGLGYIGLPTALILAKSGLKVVGTDYNKTLVESLNKGQLTFKEKGLYELFKLAINNRIEFSNDYVKTDIYIIAVPTPYMEDSKKLDSKYVLSAVNSVLNVCKKETIIIIESTISPGFIDKYIRSEIEKKGFTIVYVIYIAHAPERIIPGNMIYELEYNARIIGVDDKKIGEKIKKLYASFCKADIIITDIKIAEMSKIVENTFRDINIAFANELAQICRTDNMDVYKIIEIANMHPRVNILQPGPGVGGHCISVDPWFLVGDYPALTNLILTARKVNNAMPSHILKRIVDIMQEHNINDISQVGLYGLTYKEDVDDTRESPTLQLINKMDKQLIVGVKVFDPFIKERIVEHQYMKFKDFISEIKIIVIMVAHTHIKENMHIIKNKLILDTKNVCPFDKTYKI